MAGSVTGYVFVYDYRGRLVRRFATGSGGLINDVALAPNGDAYVTDSMRGLLFRIKAKALSKRTSKTTRIGPFVRLANTPVGQFSNGVVTAGDRYALVVGTVERRAGAGGPEDQAGQGGLRTWRCPLATAWPARVARSTW